MISGDGWSAGLTGYVVDEPLRFERGDVVFEAIHWSSIGWARTEKRTLLAVGDG